MKILFNNTIFFNQKVGGISRYICCLGNELINLNLDVKIVAPIFKNIYLKNFPGKNFRGTYFPRYPMYNFLEKYSNFILKKNILKFSPDIIHDTYYSKNIVFTKDSKKIITVHDLIHEKYSDSYKKSEEIINLKKTAFKNCNHFICVSNNTKKDLIEYYKIPENKISVIYHGANHLLKYQNYEEKNFFYKEKNKKGKVYEKPYILYVGKRSKYKNFNLIIDVFSKSKKLSKDFDIICFGGEKFSKEENEKFYKLNIVNNLKNVNQSDDELKNYYLKARALIFPSLYEGFGLPLVESMSLGCPIFCSNTSSMPEICGNAAIYFNPLEVEDLLHKLENNLYSEKNLSNLISKGYKEINKFSWKKAAMETLKVYQYSS